MFHFCLFSASRHTSKPVWLVSKSVPLSNWPDPHAPYLEERKAPVPTLQGMGHITN